MKKYFFFPLFIGLVYTSFLSLSFAESGDLVLDWIRTVGGTGVDAIASLGTDNSGNLYVNGSFSFTTDIDFSSGTDIRTSSGEASDIFISKYDAEGNTLWTRSIIGPGYEWTYDIDTDTEGNVFIPGYFNEGVDFNPEGGGDVRTSSGLYDMFFTKYTPLGAYHWTRVLGGTGYDWTNGSTTDTNGNIYLVGSFEQSILLNPDDPSTLVTSSGASDGVFLKYNGSGIYQWGKVIKNTGAIGIDLIDSDTGGNFYIAGTFNDTTDFDPSAGEDIHTTEGGSDMFLSKYDADGNYLWTRTWGGTGATYPSSTLRVSPLGQIFVSGIFNDTTDFDPSAGEDIHTTEGSYDIFLSRFDQNGNFLGVITLGGPENDFANSFGFDVFGNLYIGGFFQNTVDFDPSASGSDIRTSYGGLDIFLSKYDPTGKYLWTKTAGGNSFEHIYSIQGNTRGDMYFGGCFSSTVDFSELSGGVYTSNGDCDAFIMKFHLDIPRAISANGDSGSFIDGSGGSIDILGNDTYSGGIAYSGNVTVALTGSISVSGAYIDTISERLIIPSSTPLGIYTLTYEICERLSPYNCSSTNVTLSIVSQGGRGNSTGSQSTGTENVGALSGPGGASTQSSLSLSSSSSLTSVPALTPRNISSSGMVQVWNLEPIQSCENIVKYLDDPRLPEYGKSIGILNMDEAGRRLTRAEFLKIVIHALGSTSLVDRKNLVVRSFEDTREKAWYNPYLQYALDTGIIRSNSGENIRFRPNEKITRAEASEIIIRITRASTNTGTENPFVDVGMENPYKPFIDTAYDFCLVEGRRVIKTGSTIRRYYEPQDSLTLAETLKVLFNREYRFGK